MPDDPTPHGTGRRILTERQLQGMAMLREEGRTFREIAEAFARQGVTISEGAISWQCLRLGADGPPHRRNPTFRIERPYRRGKFIVRPYTAEDDAKLLEMEAAGANYCDMARALGRKPNSIRGRMMTLARQEARAEEMAE